jgi:catalase
VDHLVDDIVAHASKGVSSAMQDRVVDYWTETHRGVGERVARRLRRGG